MKNCYILILGLFLSMAMPAHADLNEVAKALATNPKAEFTANLKTVNDPIDIEVSVGSNAVLKATSTPEEFVSAVRALVPSKTIKSEQYTYLLQWQGLSLVANGKTLPVYDVLADIKSGQADASTPDAQDGYISENNKVLSVVGPYVSYRTHGDQYFAGAAHPNEWDDFATADVKKLGSVAGGDSSANLLDIVDEASLVAALKADKALAKLVKGAEATSALQAATTVEQVEDALYKGFSDNCYSFPGFDNKISSFAIYDYDPTKNLVAVRLPIGAAAHACQAEAPMVQLGLLVKPLTGTEYLFRDLVKNGDGLLMKNVAK